MCCVHVSLATVSSCNKLDHQASGCRFNAIMLHILSPHFFRCVVPWQPGRRVHADDDASVRVARVRMIQQQTAHLSSSVNACAVAVVSRDNPNRTQLRGVRLQTRTHFTHFRTHRRTATLVDTNALGLWDRMHTHITEETGRERVHVRIPASSQGGGSQFMLFWHCILHMCVVVVCIPQPQSTFPFAWRTSSTERLCYQRERERARECCPSSSTRMLPIPIICVPVWALVEGIAQTMTRT